MKRLLYCLLAAGFCLSCKPKPVSLKDEFTPIVHGLWVKKDYIDSVLKTKSPALVQQTPSDITVMQIDTKKIKGDSLKVDIGKATHAFSVIPMVFVPGKKPHTIVMADTDVEYTISGEDTILTLHYVKGGKPASTQYIKALHDAPKEHLGDGLNLLLNRGLFAGKYILQENGAAKEIEFKENGTVTGLGKYKTYYINNDFVYGLHTVDGIVLDMGTKDESGLGFKIKGDTLDLYNIIFDESSENTTITNLKYHLVRKK